MIVVADTGPLNYLVQIGCEMLLLELYSRVLVPAAVIDELNDPRAPSEVRIWMADLPPWLEICRTASPADPSLSYLDPGEREAIQLAEELRADLVLIDERRGRFQAKRRGLAVTGTLGVLLTAAESGLVDAKMAYLRLIERTTFRTSPELDAEFFSRLDRRR